MGIFIIKWNKVFFVDILLLMVGGFVYIIVVEGVEFVGFNIYFDRVFERFIFDDIFVLGCRVEYEKF